jgi:hypothetical protein
MDAPSELNHGRWIVKCPVCPMAWLEHLVPEVCTNCGTEITVVPPGDKERLAIHHAVHLRPVENQNWAPGEPVDQLLAENIENGLGDPSNLGQG